MPGAIMYTLADAIHQAAKLASDKVAVIDGDLRLTYREFSARCARLAGGLRRLGLLKGDRVAILANNCHEYLEAYVSVPAAGFALVPLNTRHAQPEVEYVLKDSGARVLLCDREPGALVDAVERTVRLGSEYEALLSDADAISLGEHVSENDLAGLFYTGGTTGFSKGVMLSHRNLIANTYHWMSVLPQRAEDVVLLMAPLFHAAGSNSIVANIWHTKKQVVLGTFGPAQALDLIAQHGVTETLGVPSMLAAIAEEQRLRPRAITSLRVIAHGGAPIATEVLRRVRDAFPNTELLGVYGATELSPLVTALSCEHELLDEPRARSCGRPVNGVNVRIISPTGQALPCGEPGEVAVRGPNVMLGYWRKPAETAAALSEGEFKTGDVGYLDDQNYLFLVDRCKDMIVSGGENIYSTEVEETLYRHPAVLEAAVFGIPDDKWGEAVHAAVVPKSSQQAVTAAELIEFCRRYVAGYKVPKAIDIRSEPLPKSGAGKVLKRELRAPFWAGQDRAVR